MTLIKLGNSFKDFQGRHASQNHLAWASYNLF